MLNSKELQEIRSYLLEKKLPIDLVIEVNEHFICQIQQVQSTEDVCFHEAFEKVKSTWFSDLRLYWNKSLDLEDSSDFIRKAKKEINLFYLKQSIPLSIIGLVSVFLVAMKCSPSIFSLYLTLLVGVPVVFIIISYLRNYKLFNLPKKYPNYILTIHQYYLSGIFVLGSAVINMLNSTWSSPERTRDFFIIHNISDLSFRLLFALLLLMVIFIGISFSYISQKKYLQQLKAVQPFLKYLQQV